MRRLLAVGALSLVVLVAGGAAADTFAVTLVSQTNSTVTLGWTPQPGYGYLFSADGTLVSRTNDASRSTVKFSKSFSSYEVAVIVKGATGTYPTAPPPAQCADGVDNDGDGKIDLADPGCTGPTDNDETNVAPPPPVQCADGLDNDGDGKIDYPADPGCSSATDTDETNAPPPPTGFPDASNTGVPAGTTLTAYTGPSNITAANTVITGKTIGCLDINAPGVVIRNSRISCNGFYAILVADSGPGTLLIEDSEIDCKDTGGTALGEAEIVAHRLNISKCENGFDINQNVTVEDSYIHDLFQSASAHPDGIQFATGRWNGSTYVCCTQNVTIRHNTIYGTSEVDGAQGNAAIIDHAGGVTSNILIDNNLLAGGGYTLYCAIGFKGVNYRVTNNHFSTRFSSKVGFYGPSADCADETQSGNVIHETGAALPLS